MSDAILPTDQVSENGQAEPPIAFETAPDPFDLERLRISLDDASAIGVKKALLTVPVRKPGNSAYVQVHPNKSYRLPTAMVELREERELYLVGESMRADLSTDATYSLRILFTAITRHGVVFLWPIRLPDASGRIDQWSLSALEAAEIATSRWCRVVSNMHLGAYEIFEASGDLPKPTWPDVSFKELLRIAFKQRFIDSPDHPIVRKLRGET